MIEIDGSQKSGSGTILRLSVALSAITGTPLHIFNIRYNRPKPGLRPQHLEAVITAGKLCNAEITGADLNSTELRFKPKKINGGKILAEIGTAGSISALIMTVLPICLFANNPVRLHITKGGTDVSHSPTINFMRFVFLKTLKKMGINASIKINSYGYYPKGMGEVILETNPSLYLKPINLAQFGKINHIEGISISTFLKKRKVAERQAKAAIAYLKGKEYNADIKIVYDRSNPFQKGSSITLWMETTTGILIGADAIGSTRKSSEEVGREAARKLCFDLQSNPTVDVNLSDMLIPYMALSKGVSTFLTRSISNHLETNIWLMEKLLNTSFTIKKIDHLYRITKSE
ncbi:MAG: RNA 3'-terminal phosphate cyclase [Candidatus Bathyarchaeota archaeon]|nr:RNA 3'-terminal phosphate cyclase [Candidatus Bathyarchaeota archaeon]